MKRTTPLTPALGALVAAALLTAETAAAGDNTIGFVERFVLAEDRGAVLAELVPGTEDYYYLHALHFEHTGGDAALGALMKAWRERGAHSELRRRVEHRQALLAYDENPEATLDYLKRVLGLRFDDARPVPERERDLPSELDPESVSPAAFYEAALGGTSSLENLTMAGLDWLALSDHALGPDQRHHLLSLLARPDYPRLVELVAAELRREGAPGFGAHPVHGQMLKAQLEALLEAVPSLANDETFVLTYLGKLHPPADVVLSRSPEARGAFLREAWAFVEGLEPAFNPLKAHVLYHLLDHGRHGGDYSRDLFMAYLALPRPVPYISPVYRRENPGLWNHAADLGLDYRSTTTHPPVGDDTPLVRDFLLHFLAGSESLSPFDRFLANDFLEAAYAEAKILAGEGDPEALAALLTPAQFAALRDRVDIDFALTNPQIFAPGEDVRLDVFVKNVPDLLAKVYEINTGNVYRLTGREVGTDLDLDGLVPNAEATHAYGEPAFRRVRRTFEFPSLKDRRGVWIIEFVGNGISSRALVRKGSLRPLVRTTSAGQAVTVLDEAGAVRPDAIAEFGGKEYKADEDGDILIPFSTDPGTKPLILTDRSGFAALAELDHKGEDYALRAAVHVEQESLLPQHLARAAVRPEMQVAGQPVSVAAIEDAKVAVTTTNAEGHSATSEFVDVTFSDSEATVVEFRVPAGTVAVQVDVTGEVRRLSDGGTVTLADSHTFEINGIDQTVRTSDLYLSRDANGHLLELLGKTGEPLPSRAVAVEFRRPGFKNAIHQTFKTGGRGTVRLGALEGVSEIVATTPDGTRRTFHPARDHVAPPSAIHALAGEEVAVPVSAGGGDAPGRGAFSLLEINTAGTPVRDRFDALALGGGFVRAEGLPAGDYILTLKDEFYPNIPTDDGFVTVHIRLTDGTRVRGHLVGENRTLESHGARPLHIAGIGTAEDTLTIAVAHATPATRLHLATTRFVPDAPFHPFANLAARRAGPGLVIPAYRPSVYLSGRDIGDEYRYVLERRSAPVFPGSLMPRPGLLLNPWALRDTETGVQTAAAGEDLRRLEHDQEPMFDEEAPATQMRRDKMERDRQQAPATPSLDFLADQGVAVFNLTPNADGVVEIPLADLGGRPLVHVFATNGFSSTYRTAVLPGEHDTPFLDLRLAAALEADRHFARQNAIDTIPEGGSLVLDDLRTAELETYGSLDDLMAYFLAVEDQAGGPRPTTLATFRFLTAWPTLTDAEKQERYSEFASHELDFFLSRKDPDFFRRVVAPYLANKRDKRFLDEYLTGADLRPYLRPWRFSGLNTFERILLGQRVEGEADAVRELVEDALEIMRPTHSENEFSYHFFDSALFARGGRFGLENTRDAPLDGVEDFAAFAPESAAPAAPASQLERKLGRELAEQIDLKSADSDVAFDISEAGSIMAGAAVHPQELDRLAALGDMAKFGELRGSAARLYVAPEQTREWAENNYYHLPLAQQNAELISPNPFWLDYAAWDGEAPFLSPHFPEAANSLAEMLLALAVTDLPFTAEVPELAIEDGRATLTPNSTVLAFYRRLREAPMAGDDALPLLVSQSLYRHDEPTEVRDGKRVQKSVTDEFLTGVVYASKVVVSNPSSTPRDLSVLTQIPAGSVPVSGSETSDTIAVSLDPYATHAFDLFFYFPFPGEFEVYPAHVAEDGAIVAHASPAGPLNVVRETGVVDKTSWQYIAHHGSKADVLEFLRNENLLEVSLGQIAWRLGDDPDFFAQVTEALEARHVYDADIYRYAIHHNRSGAIGQFLLMQGGFLSECGPYLDSPLVLSDPVGRGLYQHLEYAPVINARAHKLGPRRTILNNAFHAQYHELLWALACKPELGPEDRIALTHYLLTQDRVAAALGQFARVPAAGVSEQLQFTYLAAVLAAYQGDVAAARALAVQHAEHPVDRWRERFQTVVAHLDEAAGQEPAGDAHPEDREATQDVLAAAEPTLELTVDEDASATVDYRNLDSVTVNYYAMDLEFLFSSSPFLDGDNARFSVIRPNRSEVHPLENRTGQITFKLPQEFGGRNVLVEVLGGGQRAARPHFANSLEVEVADRFGRLDVTHDGDARPLPATYVKVYALTPGGVKFYKDGYTDLRGKFDYASLTRGDDELGGVQKFSILVLNPDHGATVVEATPPTR